MSDTQHPPLSDENTDKPVEIQPVPQWIKTGGIAILALFVILFLWMTLSGGKETSKAPDPLAVENDSTSTPAAETSPADNPLAKAIEPSAKANPVKVFNESALPAAKPLQSSNIKPIQQQLNQLQQQLNHLETGFEQDQKRQDDITDLLKEMIKSLQNDVQQLKNKPHNNKAKPVAYKKSYRKKYPAKRHTSLPFTLVSIDLWGNDAYAVIRHQGQLYDVTIGQNIFGWTLVSVNADQTQAMFKNKRGISLPLRLS